MFPGLSFISSYKEYKDCVIIKAERRLYHAMERKEFEYLVLEHMAKITQELNELKSGYNELRQGQNELKQGQDELRQGQKELRQAVARIEQQHGEKLSALFDAREVQNNVNEKILSTLERMEAKLDVLQLETAHIRRVK